MDSIHHLAKKSSIFWFVNMVFFMPATIFSFLIPNWLIWLNLINFRVVNKQQMNDHYDVVLMSWPVV